jgi:hypothetical protein
VLYQYFVGINYERYHRRNITIGITILFVRGAREKKNNKTEILRVRSKRKKKLLFKKKNGFVREDYSIYSRRLFFSVYVGWMLVSSRPTKVGHSVKINALS